MMADNTTTQPNIIGIPKMHDSIAFQAGTVMVMPYLAIKEFGVHAQIAHSHRLKKEVVRAVGSF